MTVGTVALLEKAFKVTYADGLGKYIEEESDLIRWLPKEESFGGWKFWLPFKLNGSRVSTDFTTALAKKNNPKFVRMELTRSKGHGVISVVDLTTPFSIARSTATLTDSLTPKS